jgi:peptide-methionine (R)-S-oxide reductase
VRRTRCVASRRGWGAVDFDDHRRWPSFYEPKEGDAVLLREDRTLGMVRVKALCANCHSHLGHVFEGEGYPTPTDQRWCINSISLRLVPTDGQ